MVGALKAEYLWSRPEQSLFFYRGARSICFHVLRKHLACLKKSVDNACCKKVFHNETKAYPAVVISWVRYCLGSLFVCFFFEMIFDIFGGVFRSKLYIHIAIKLRLVILYKFAASKMRLEEHTG